MTFKRSLLEYLYINADVGYFIDVSDFIFNSFTEENEGVYAEIKDTLLHLKNQRFIYILHTSNIRFGENIPKKDTQPIINELITFKTFKERDDRISIKLTPEGKDYFLNIKREERQDEFLRKQTESAVSTGESVITTNASIVKMNDVTIPDNFRIQKNLTTISLIFTGLTVVITLASLIKQCSQDKSDTATQLLLRQRLQLQGDSLRIHQTRLDSLSRANKGGANPLDTSKPK